MRSYDDLVNLYILIDEINKYGYSKTNIIGSIESRKKYKNEKEINDMTVTIIGSVKDDKKINECKKFFENLGFKVNSPLDLKNQQLSLIQIQSIWIQKIKDSDMVVAIPKEILIEGDGGTRYSLNFGESTSYEMATALDLGKQIVFW